MENLIGEPYYYSPFHGEIEPAPVSIVAVRNLVNHTSTRMMQVKLEDGRWVNLDRILFEILPADSQSGPDSREGITIKGDLLPCPHCGAMQDMYAEAKRIKLENAGLISSLVMGEPMPGICGCCRKPFTFRIARTYRIDPPVPEGDNDGLS
jgi:hypothetical protein